MSATDRTPSLRLFALAAFLLAAGVLSLRAYALFGSVKAEPVGSPIEQELTYLLEPITGAQKVRVSLTTQRPRTVLVMVDGEIGTNLNPLRTRVETILAASIDFVPEQETLSLSQFPFARGVGARLTPSQLAEIIGLGVLCIFLGGALLAPQRPVKQAGATQDRNPVDLTSVASTRRIARSDPPNSDRAAAATLAETEPNQTARLVRDWMSYAED